MLGGQNDLQKKGEILDEVEYGKQVFFFNCYQVFSEPQFELSELNTLVSLPYNEKVYDMQYLINENEMLFLQFRNKVNSAILLSLSQ